MFIIIILINNNNCNNSHYNINPLVPLEIVSVTLSPHNCLLDGVVNQIQCIVKGLPDPTVNFERSSLVVNCNGSCEKTIKVEGVVTTANLTFYNVSSTDQGAWIIIHVHVHTLHVHMDVLLYV